MGNDTTILIATDGSDAAVFAGERAVELFGTEGVSYSVVSVGEIYAPPMSALGITPALFTITRDADGTVLPIDLATERAAEMADAIDADSTATAIAHAGGAGPAICDLATEIGADVLVVGAHERSWWERLVEESTSDYLLRHAPCDVLVVRPVPDNSAS